MVQILLKAQSSISFLPHLSTAMTQLGFPLTVFNRVIITEKLVGVSWKTNRKCCQNETFFIPQRMTSVWFGSVAAHEWMLPLTVRDSFGFYRSKLLFFLLTFYYCHFFFSWLLRLSNTIVYALITQTGLLCTFGWCAKSLYFAILSVRWLTHPTVTNSGFKCQQNWHTIRLSKSNLHYTVNFVVKSWNKPYWLYCAFEKCYLTAHHMCVYSFHISWELNKHSRPTSSCCVDISCWLKTQLVMKGGMQNEGRKQPQITAEEWPIYTKCGFRLGSSRQREIHCVSQLDCHCNFNAI